MDDATRTTTFLALRPIVAAHRAKLAVTDAFRKRAGLGFYSLEHKIPKAGRAQFAVLFAHPRDVRLYLYPIRAFPKLVVPKLLAMKIVSRSVIVWKALPTAAETKAVARLLATAAALVAERRRLEPTRLYTARPKVTSGSQRVRSQPRRRTSPRQARARR